MGAIEGSTLRPVCPQCRGTLQALATGGHRCTACGAEFPQRATVEVFLTDEEWRKCEEGLVAEREILDRYEYARRQVPLTLQYYDWWIARMFAEVPATHRGPLVELMCGAAEVTRRRPAHFPSSFALDFNADMVAKAAADFAARGDKSVTVVCGTAARLPLPDACTDTVIIQGALHHARPVLAQILGEVNRILKPGGVFVGSEPANDHPLTRAIRHWQYRRSHLQGHDPDEDGFSRQDLAVAFSAAGLRLDRYQQFGFIAYPLMGNTDEIPLLQNSRAFRFGRALLALDRALEYVPLVRGLAWASLFRAFKAPAR